MTETIRRAGAVIGIALIVSVVTQIIYMITLGGPSPADPSQGVVHADVLRYFTERWGAIGTVWTIELAAFVATAAAAMVLLARGVAAPAALAALALSGIFNAIQVGMGLSMFKPAAEAGADLMPVLGTILSGAFFLYFLAKALIGLAGIGLGLALYARSTGLVRVLAIAAVIVGAVAAGTNIVALPQGRALTMAAGATGTLAALFTGVVAWLTTRGVVADARTERI